MTDPTTVVYLLTGLPGSGKTTFAKALERNGVTRLSVDERILARHGRLGRDYPEADHLALLGPIVEEVRQQLVELIQAGRSVVLDHGLGRRAERDDYKRLVVEHGGTWRLVHFPIDRVELLRRLAVRNDEENTGTMSPETLTWIAEHSEEPAGEGEEPAESFSGRLSGPAAAG
jgi:predicted kinase